MSAQAIIKELQGYRQGKIGNGISIDLALRIFAIVRELVDHETIIKEEQKEIILQLQLFLKHIVNEVSIYPLPTKEINDRIAIFEQAYNLLSTSTIKSIDKIVNPQKLTDFFLCFIFPCITKMRQKQWKKLINIIMTTPKKKQQIRFKLSHGSFITLKQYVILKMLAFHILMMQQSTMKQQVLVSVILDALVFGSEGKIMIKEIEENVGVLFRGIGCHQLPGCEVLLYQLLDKYVNEFVESYKKMDKAELWVYDPKIINVILSWAIKINKNSVKFKQIKTSSLQKQNQHLCNYCGGTLTAISQQYNLEVGDNSYMIGQCELCGNKNKINGKLQQRIYNLMTYQLGTHSLSVFNPKSIMNQISGLDFYRKVMNLEVAPCCPSQVNQELSFIHGNLIATISALKLNLDRYIPKLLAILVIMSNSPEISVRTKVIATIKVILQNYQQYLLQRNHSDMQKIRICIENRCNDVEPKVRMQALGAYLMMGNCEMDTVFGIIDSQANNLVSDKQIVALSEKLCRLVIKFMKYSPSQKIISQTSKAIILMAALAKMSHSDNPQKPSSHRQKKKGNIINKSFKKIRSDISYTLQLASYNRINIFPSILSSPLITQLPVQSNKFQLFPLKPQYQLINPPEIIDLILEIGFQENYVEQSLIKEIANVVVDFDDRQIRKKRFWLKSQIICLQLLNYGTHITLMQNMISRTYISMISIFTQIEILLSLLKSNEDKRDHHHRDLYSLFWKYLTSDLLNRLVIDPQSSKCEDKIYLIGELLFEIDMKFRNQQPTQQLCQYYLSILTQKPIEIKTKILQIITSISVFIPAHNNVDRIYEMIMNNFGPHKPEIYVGMLCRIWQLSPKKMQREFILSILEKSQSHQIFHKIFKTFYHMVNNKTLKIQQLEHLRNIVTAIMQQPSNQIQNPRPFCQKCSYLYAVIWQMIKKGLMTYISIKAYIIYGLVKSQQKHSSAEQQTIIIISKKIIEQSVEDLYSGNQIFTSFSDSLKSIVIHHRGTIYNLDLNILENGPNAQWMSSHQKTNFSLKPSLLKAICQYINMIGITRQVQNLYKNQIEQMSVQIEGLWVLCGSILDIKAIFGFELERLSGVLNTLVNSCYRDVILEVEKWRNQQGDTKMKSKSSQIEGIGVKNAVMTLLKLLQSLDYLLQGEAYTSALTNKKNQPLHLNLKPNTQKNSHTNSHHQNLEVLVKQLQTLYDKTIYGQDSEDDNDTEQTEMKFKGGNRKPRKQTRKKQPKHRKQGHPKTKKARATSSTKLSYDGIDLITEEEQIDYRMKLRTRNSTKMKPI